MSIAYNYSSSADTLKFPIVHYIRPDISSNELIPVVVALEGPQVREMLRDFSTDVFHAAMDTAIKKIVRRGKVHGSVGFLEIFRLTYDSSNCHVKDIYPMKIKFHFNIGPRDTYRNGFIIPPPDDDQSVVSSVTSSRIVSSPPISNNTLLSHVKFIPANSISRDSSSATLINASSPSNSLPDFESLNLEFMEKINDGLRVENVDKVFVENVVMENTETFESQPNNSQAPEHSETFDRIETDINIAMEVTNTVDSSNTANVFTESNLEQIISPTESQSTQQPVEEEQQQQASQPEQTFLEKIQSYNSTIRREGVISIRTMDKSTLLTINPADINNEKDHENHDDQTDYSEGPLSKKSKLNANLVVNPVAPSLMSSIDSLELNLNLNNSKSKRYGGSTTNGSQPLGRSILFSQLPEPRTRNQVRHQVQKFQQQSSTQTQPKNKQPLYYQPKIAKVPSLTASSSESSSDEIQMPRVKRIIREESVVYPSLVDVKTPTPASKPVPETTKSSTSNFTTPVPTTFPKSSSFNSDATTEILTPSSTRTNRSAMQSPNKRKLSEMSPYLSPQQRQYIISQYKKEHPGLPVPSRLLVKRRVTVERPSVFGSVYSGIQKLFRTE
ncbi:hypothetical protein HK098_005637 [Nowakowskiella sp. JEL0407]|nr:hypothetical protein HK098_005637 [Nowakowskiella sp. JEL0407]